LNYRGLNINDISKNRLGWQSKHWYNILIWQRTHPL